MRKCFYGFIDCLSNNLCQICRNRSNNWFQVRDDGTSIYFYVAVYGDSYTPLTVWYLSTQAGKRITPICSRKHMLAHCNSNP